MIPEYVANLVSKFSFIKSYERKGIYWYFYLQDDCSIKNFKCLIGRTTKKSLIRKIKYIKKKINYDEEVLDWQRQKK